MFNNCYYFVNDVVISVGVVYFGYLVMNDSFIISSCSLNIMLLNSWLFWYEVGYNLVEVFFNVDGVIEVVNNLFVLYM